mgnify:CR=1 FL=1
MDTLILDGKLVAHSIKNKIKEKAIKLQQEKNITPGLALLLVGDNPASKVYVNSKAKTCEELGFMSIIYELSTNTTEESVLKIINEWNNNDAIHGILVQLPLPKHISENKVLEAISPDKDVDGFHPVNVGKLVLGLDGFVPCTPAGIIEIMKFYNINPNKKNVVVIGRSNIVGKPMLNLLYQKRDWSNATVTICHTGTQNLHYYTKNADIVIAAMGYPKFLKAEHIKEGTVIIDVGINRIEDNTKKSGYRLVGDVDYEDCFPKCSAITPVPGGVGPLTIAMLMSNTLKAAINHKDK